MLVNLVVGCCGEYGRGEGYQHTADEDGALPPEPQHHTVTHHRAENEDFDLMPGPS